MNRKIAVVGLGYVGLPVAVAFGRKHRVIGFDVNSRRIKTLKEGSDYTNEVSTDDLNKSNILFTDDPKYLSEADFVIVAVPTPIDSQNQPNLSPLLNASETVGRNIKQGTIVVYESTVYPGATEEECVPILERASGMRYGEEFFVGYSPERINPGDKEHTFTKILKVVAGQTSEITNIIAEVYGSVIEAGIHKASSIKVAEAAKVIENTQRDVNIALMNELALIFDRIGVDTKEVLEAAGTKWNFLKFSPGLVGGHCIGVDPYYLTHKAQTVGHYPEVILAGRRINDSIGRYIARTVIKKLINHGIVIQGATVTVLGLTFKENVPDLRNSKAIDIIRELLEYGVNVQVSDIHADSGEAKREYGVDLVPFNKLEPADALILAVPHTEYYEKGWPAIKTLLRENEAVVADIKSILPIKSKPQEIDLWRL